MAMSLSSLRIPSVSHATDAFGEEKGLLICRPDRSCAPFFTIPEGCYALVTDAGADIDYSDGQAVWPAGFHMGLPWRLRVSNLVTKQNVVFDMPVKGCITRDNVTVEIDVAIVFRIMGDTTKARDNTRGHILVRKFVHEVGARGLEQQLRGAQEEEVRALARTMKHTEVYGLRNKGTRDTIKGTLATMEAGGEEAHGLHVTPLGTPPPDEAATLEGQYDEQDASNAVASSTKGSDHCLKMKNSLNRQFQPQGVMITAVIIKNVALPPNIAEQMTGKTLVISSVAEQKMNQQYDMQQIVYDQEVDTLNQAHAEQREEEKQNSEQKMNEVQIRLGKLKAEAKKTEMHIGEADSVAVRQIEADVALQTSRLKNSQDAAVTEMRAKSQRTAAKLRAETGAFVTEKASEASLEVTKNNADATAILAEAEGICAPMLEAMKTHTTDNKRVEVMKSLSDNPDLVISSSSSEEVNAMMMCDAVLTNTEPGKPLSRSQVLAELVMLQKGSRVYMGHDMATAA
ncbi:unnamed protein product [Ectocarpus sp. 12 AP-2014]